MPMGANIDAQTDVEDEAPGAGLRTALSNAAMNGHTETVRKLVSLGAKLDAKQKDGWSSLHFAAKNGWDETVAALVELGVDVPQALVRHQRLGVARIERRGRGFVRVDAQAAGAEVERDVVDDLVLVRAGLRIVALL